MKGEVKGIGIQVRESGKWTYKKVISDVRGCPNKALEKFAFTGYRMAFGRKIRIDREILLYLHNELNRRNRNGIYIYDDRKERKTFRRTNRELVTAS